MVTLYSIGCPQCDVLETKLKQKNIDFNILGKKEIIAKGLADLPMPQLKVDDKMLDYMQALAWLKGVNANE